MARSSRLFHMALAAAAVAAGCGPDAQPESPTIERRNAALTTNISLSADAYVRSGSYAATNFGTATTINSDSDDVGTVLQSYVRFSVGSLGGTVTSARLRLYVTNATAGAHDVKRVSNTSWSESSITWNNKPAVDGALVATIPSASAGAWLDVDVTSVIAANTTVTLAIVPRSTDGLDISSRESATNKPQLVIDTATPNSGPSTDANLKIAFVGDTADGSNWTSVLNLVQSEGAAAVVTAGDMTYDADPAGWWAATEAVVGTSYPVFLARGNHDDSSWANFLPKAANHLGGATRTNGPHNAAYKTVFRGLDIASIMKGDTGTTINNLFGSDGHYWKVCAWHQNQNKMQVGGKGDEMGWDVYQTCLAKGAIIMTGHEHSYHRSKTLTNAQTQTVDGSCSSGSNLCVGPGRTFVTVVGTGGTGLRAQVRCTPTESTAPYASLNTSDTSCPMWASIYTTNQGANYGAQFITFNVDGNPKKARGYFKTISGQTIDTFTIFAD